MNNARNYRYRSGAWTGLAPRSTAERWPPHPVTFRNGFWRQLLLLVCGH